MRVREPLGHAGGRAAATHEPVHADGGEGERLLVTVAAEADEQRLLVEQPDAAGEWVNPQPCLERLLHGQRDGHLALAAAFASDEQPLVPGVGAGAAQITRAEASELGGAKPAVAEHPKQSVVAFAGERAAVRNTDQVRVVRVGERLRRSRLVPRDPHAVDLILAAEVAGERSDH